VFERFKSTFNTQKVNLKNIYMFGKKIKSAFKDLKSLKIAKTHFWQKLKNEVFAKKCFIT
jgi:hypothetical protein